MTHLDLRLTAAALDFWIDVHLHRFGDRWLAVADVAGDPELGHGAAPVEAVEMALAGLGPEAQGWMVTANRRSIIVASRRR